MKNTSFSLVFQDSFSLVAMKNTFKGIYEKKKLVSIEYNCLNYSEQRKKQVEFLFLLHWGFVWECNAFSNWVYS